MMNLRKTTNRLWLASLLISTTLITYSASANMDRIAAVVNQDVVLVSEVGEMARKIQASGNVKADQSIAEQALERLILEKLQLQAAKRSGIEADDASIERAMANVAQRNNLAPSQLKDALAREGINYQSFRRDLADQLIINSLKRRESSKSAQVSDQEVEDLIASEAKQLSSGKSYYVQDLLVAVPQPHTVKGFEKAKQNATQLRQRALTSPDFLKTRYANSTATDLGWQDSKTLSYAYLKALTQLDKGQISHVIHDAKGFHVLKLVDKRGGVNTTSQQVNVRHILIATEEANAKAKIEAIRLQLVKGADFATLAKLNSADKGSGSNGGDLGWSDSKRYVPEFARATETLAINTLSPVIRTKFGYHLLEVKGRREVDASQSALKAKARQAILGKRQTQDYDAWLQSLRNNAHIEYRVKP